MLLQLMKVQRVRAATVNVSVFDCVPLPSSTTRVPLPDGTMVEAAAIASPITGQTYVINGVVNALHGIDIVGALPVIIKALAEPETVALLRYLGAWYAWRRRGAAASAVRAALTTRALAAGLDHWVLSTRDVRRHLSGESTAPLPGLRPLEPGVFKPLLDAVVMKEKKALLTDLLLHLGASSFHTIADCALTAGGPLNDGFKHGDDATKASLVCCAGVAAMILCVTTCVLLHMSPLQVALLLEGMPQESICQLLACPYHVHTDGAPPVVGAGACASAIGGGGGGGPAHCSVRSPLRRRHRDDYVRPTLPQRGR